MTSSDWDGVFGSSGEILTRRSALGVLAGGLIAISGSGTAEARKQRKRRHARQRKARVGIEAAKQRPIGDFLAAQGQTALFVPGVDDVLGWAEPPFDTATPFAWIDYVGVVNDLLGTALGTTSSGKVTERPRPGGRTVHVVLHTNNALSWEISIDTTGDIGGQIAAKPPEFGYRPLDVVGNPSLAALADVNMQAVFNDDKQVGSALPDLVRGWILGQIPGFELVSIKFHAQATGSLRPAYGVPDGTPGRLTVAQTGVQLNRPDRQGAIADGFPAEQVRLQQIGN